MAATGKVSHAEAEYKFVADAETNMAPTVVFAMPVNNKTEYIMKIARDVLGAKIVLAKNDRAAAIQQLRAAVAAQNSLNCRTIGVQQNWISRSRHTPELLPDEFSGMGNCPASHLQADWICVFKSAISRCCALSAPIV
jgi:hypothetical protein